MVATDKWVYMFNGEGHIERRIPLSRDTLSNEVKTLTPLTVDDYIKRGGDKREFIKESAVTVAIDLCIFKGILLYSFI